MSPVASFSRSARFVVGECSNHRSALSSAIAVGTSFFCKIVDRVTGMSFLCLVVDVVPPFWSFVFGPVVLFFVFAFCPTTPSCCLPHLRLLMSSFGFLRSWLPADASGVLFCPWLFFTILSLLPTLVLTHYRRTDVYYGF